MSDVVSNNGASHGMHQITAGDKQRLDSLATEIAFFASAATINEMQAGKALMEARKLLKDDRNFGQWRDEMLPGLHRKQALRYMQVAEQYGDKPKIVEALSFRALRSLSAPSTPAEVRETVEKLVDEGKQVTAAEIDRLKREVSEAKSTAENATKERDKFKAQTETLLGNQQELLKAAETRVREQAERDIQAARSEAQLSREALEAERDKLSRVADEMKAAAARETDARVEELAQSEIKRRQSEFDQIKAKHDDMVSRIERRSHALKEIEARLAKQDAALRRVTSVDYEVQSVLKESGELVRQQALFMITLNDLDKFDQHPDKVRQAVSQLSQQCRKLADVLDNIYKPRLKIIEGDAG